MSTTMTEEPTMRELLGFPRQFIVVVTGGRDYGMIQLNSQDASKGVWTYDRAARQIRNLFDQLDSLHRDHKITEIRHGAMTGADAWASRWAYENKVDTNPFGALWGSLDSAAGPFRNRLMVTGRKPLAECPPDLCVAFPGGRGTNECVALAQKYGVPVKDLR